MRGSSLLASSTSARAQAISVNGQLGARTAVQAARANELGAAAVASNDLVSALDWFEAGLNSLGDTDADQSTRAMLLTNRSCALTRMQRFDEALRDAEECTGQNPELARGHQVRGAALLGLGRRDEALAALELAVQIGDPADPEPNLHLLAAKHSLPERVQIALQRLHSAESRFRPLSQAPQSSAQGLSRVQEVKDLNIVANAVDVRSPQPRLVVIRSITVNNMPGGDEWGRCKPFVRVAVGNTEVRTKTLTCMKGDGLAKSLEKLGIGPGVPCSDTAVWPEPFQLEFDKSTDLVMTVRLLDVRDFGWEHETGRVQVPLREFSHRVQEKRFVLLERTDPVKDVLDTDISLPFEHGATEGVCRAPHLYAGIGGSPSGMKPVLGHDGVKVATVSIAAHVPADAGDGPVGIGVHIRVHRRGDASELVVDGLSSNYLLCAGHVPEPNDVVLSIDGVDMRGQQLSRAVALTMGPLGSSCHLELQRHNAANDSPITIESVLGRCAMDIQDPAPCDLPSRDAWTDDQQVNTLTSALDTRARLLAGRSLANQGTASHTTTYSSSQDRGRSFRLDVMENDASSPALCPSTTPATGGRAVEQEPLAVRVARDALNTAARHCARVRELHEALTKRRRAPLPQ